MRIRPGHLDGVGRLEAARLQRGDRRNRRQWPRVGWRPHNQSEWRTTPAVPPVGKYFQPDRAANALGAIGDSAIVDISGFGGQALSSAPVLLQEWAHALPSDLQARRKRIVDPNSGIVDVAAIRATGVGPIINLAILDKDGAGSPIGRGFYVAPNTLFETGE